LQSLKCQQMLFALDLTFATILVRCLSFQYLVTTVDKANATGVQLDLSAQTECLALNVPTRPRQVLDLVVV
jgi:hypothetical protein